MANYRSGEAAPLGGEAADQHGRPQGVVPGAFRIKGQSVADVSQPDELLRREYPTRVLLLEQPRVIALSDALGVDPPGLALTCVIPNADAAPAITQATILPLLFVSSVFIHLNNPPAWLAYVGDVGYSATVALVALELAGVHGASVYDGAFSEWTADPGRPVDYGLGR